MEINELKYYLDDLLIKIEQARNLLYSGKFVQCYNKLQGLLTSCRNLMCNLEKSNNEDKLDNKIPTETPVKNPSELTGT